MPPIPHVEPGTPAAALSAPFRGWSPDELLAYYRSRSSVQYFAVADKVEAGRSKVDSIVHSCFEFNGETYQLPAGFDWTSNPSPDLEWLIMLHKFYYAVGLGIAYHETGERRYVEAWTALTSAWIEQVELDFLPTDVMGRRIQNWIWAHYYFVTLHPECPLAPDFYVRFLESIAQQVCFLRRNLTPERNHRTLELYAIFMAAVVFPELEGAEQWLAFARHELWLNMQADLLPDGVQRELSTDYHHIVLRNYLGARRLAQLNGIVMPAGTDRLIRGALDFALHIHKPDGTIPSLSDGDTGSFLELLEQGYALYGDPALLYVASRGAAGTPPAARSRGFAASGYYVLRSGWGDGAEPYDAERYLVFDCGPLGAGNHGHLDLLSFELAAYGRSLVVDPGRYTYDEAGATNWRALFRGTAYHNTVLVDGQDQTRYRLNGSKYRLDGPEPERELRAFVSRPGFDFVHGVARSHAYGVIHERSIFFACPEYWIVSDLLRAAETHRYDVLFHLSEAALGNVSVAHEQGCRIVDTPGLLIVQPDEPSVELLVEDGFVSPAYGIKRRAPVVRFTRRAAGAGFHTLLYPYNGARPAVQVERLPVYDAGGLCPDARAVALSITITTREQRFSDMYLMAYQPPSEAYNAGELTLRGTLLYQRKDRHEHVVHSYAV